MDHGFGWRHGFIRHSPRTQDTSLLKKQDGPRNCETPGENGGLMVVEWDSPPDFLDDLADFTIWLDPHSISAWFLNLSEFLHWEL